MPNKLNRKGVSKANSLIKDGRVNEDDSWSFSAEEGNRVLGDPPDWSKYSSVHLGINPDADDETKARYKYPFAKYDGDTIKLYRSGIRAVRSRASQQGDDEISEAARRILDKLDEKRISDIEAKVAANAEIFKQLNVVIGVIAERLGIEGETKC